MAKRSRTKARDSQPAQGEVGPRQPCPCGSGKRYKACHGAAGGAPAVFVNRPFQGLPSECDVVALRELVPAATAPLTLADGVGDGRPVQLCSLLPMAAPAMVRESGQIWLGLQVQHNFGDPARDLGAVLLKAFESEPGIVGLTDPPGEGPRLQDLVVGDRLDVSVHEGFEYWIADVDDRDGMAAALEQANEAATPTARLHAAGKDDLATGSRFVGMFRAHGLLAPVWDLPVGTGPEALEEPAERFAADLAAALADDSDLTAEQRSARSGLANRQVTIR